MNIKPQTQGHPKYFLADVPQELRRQALDLCYARRWCDARDLLHENGFAHYTLDDVNNFYNWAPTVLEEPAPTPNPQCSPRREEGDSASGSQPQSPAATALQQSPKPCNPSENALLAPDVITNTERKAVASNSRFLGLHEPAPSPIPVAADSIDPINPLVPIPPSNPINLLPSPNPVPPVSPPRSRRKPRLCKSGLAPKRRSKIARLPKAIRFELNTMLDDGATYEEIIDWLATKGHPGFNLKNLHKWKHGGYQDWVQDDERRDQTESLRKWAATLAAGDDEKVLVRALTNFSAARLQRLLGAVDLTAMAEQLQSNPNQCVRFFNSLLRTGKMSIEAQKLKLLEDDSMTRLIQTI
jgi:hypothetical protein